MPLQNPDTPVTFKNLEAFYHSLQPYLNGSVPVIANKFDKANLYSEQEKIIGQWVDGKPIYQKTFTGTTNVPSNSNTQDLIDLTSYNVGVIVSITGHIIVSTWGLLPIGFKGVADWVSCLYRTDTKKIVYSTYADYRVVPYTITIQYTKTTDQPISIGADTDYSTTEKVIGTWIDGKPLYQITFSLDGTYTGAMSNIFDIGSNKVVHHFFGVGLEGDSYVTIPMVNVQYSTSNFGIWIGTDGKACLRGGTKSWSHFEITVQYTKTTD